MQGTPRHTPPASATPGARRPAHAGLLFTPAHTPALYQPLTFSTLPRLLSVFHYSHCSVTAHWRTCSVLEPAARLATHTVQEPASVTASWAHAIASRGPAMCGTGTVQQYSDAIQAVQHHGRSSAQSHRSRTRARAATCDMAAVLHEAQRGSPKSHPLCMHVHNLHMAWAGSGCPLDSLHSKFCT